MQVLVADPGAFDGRAFAGVLLDEVVLDAGGGRGREDTLPVDRATPHLGEGVGSLVQVGGGGVTRLHVFDVKDREPAGILLEVSPRILAGAAYPVAVKLDLDQLRVGAVKQLVKRDHAVVSGELE